MKTKDWQKVNEILLQALELDIPHRQEFIEKHCADMPEIRREVEAMLASESEAESFFGESAASNYASFFNKDDEPDALIGQEIGNYRIIREIGHGGMGTVYLATRADGKFEQKVALKLLKRELNTKDLRRRFRHERQILAALQHANIARLLDAGATSDNVPFLAMEYVEGVPIDVFCDKQNFDLKQRLKLFRLVCDAVAYAHRNLVVHRDLKPSNILVTDDGIPKLLDFGIAKLLTPEFEAQSEHTITQLGAMTPSYASPEQLKLESVSTTSDVYSLGVILYELLSGHRPFEEIEGNLQKVVKAICETEPEPPSAAVKLISEDSRPKEGEAITLKKDDILISHPPRQRKVKDKTTANKNLHTSPQFVFTNPQLLKGDLDNIVLKALKKEPDRRYSTVDFFSEDIRRYLEGLPVTARPDTFSYRAEKFIKRNRAGVLAAGLILLAIIVGVIATLWQAKIAQTERIKAENRFKDVRKLANSYIFDVYPEIENLEGSLKAREKILTNALQYLDSLANEAGGDLELQSELATAYEKIGDVQGALNNSSLGNISAGLESYKKARKLREAVATISPNNLEAKEKLANNYYVTGRTLWNNSQTKEAEEAFETGLKLRRELAAALPDSVETQNRLAVLLLDYGAIPAFNFQAEKALVLFNEALEIIEKLRQKDPENPDLKKSLTRGLRILSKAQSGLGDYDDALNGLNQAVAVSRELATQFPNDFRVQRSVWLTESMICELFIDKGDGQKVVDACIKTLPFPEKALEKEPENGVVAYDLAISHFNTSRAFRLAENPARTIEQAEKAIEVMAKLSGKTPGNLDYKRNLAIYETEMARAFIKLNQSDKALARLKNVQETLLPIVETDQETTYQYDLGLAYRLSAQAYHQKGEKIKALEFIDKAIAIFQKLKELNALRESDKNILPELEQEKAELGQ